MCKRKNACPLDLLKFYTLQWRHNWRYDVSNHQPHHCLLNRLFRRRSKKLSKLCVTGLCAGNSPVTGEFPSQMASNVEDVSIWWRHHVPLTRKGLDIIRSTARGVLKVEIAEGHLDHLIQFCLQHPALVRITVIKTIPTLQPINITSQALVFTGHITNMTQSIFYHMNTDVLCLSLWRYMYECGLHFPSIFQA